LKSRVLTCDWTGGRGSCGREPQGRAGGTPWVPGSPARLAVRPLCRRLPASHVPADHSRRSNEAGRWSGRVEEPRFLHGGSGPRRISPTRPARAAACRHASAVSRRSSSRVFRLLAGSSHRAGPLFPLGRSSPGAGNGLHLLPHSPALGLAQARVPTPHMAFLRGGRGGGGPLFRPNLLGSNGLEAEIPIGAANLLAGSCFVTFHVLPAHNFLFRRNPEPSLGDPFPSLLLFRVPSGCPCCRGGAPRGDYMESGAIGRTRTRHTVRSTE